MAKAQKKANYSELILNEKTFIDYLNANYDDYEVGRYVYSAGEILKEVDPIAFDAEFKKFLEIEDKFICNACNTTYESESDALKCCPLWICNECESVYYTKELAESCCQFFK